MRRGYGFDAHSGFEPRIPIAFELRGFELRKREDVRATTPAHCKGIIAARDCDLADGDGLIIRVKGPSATAALRFTSPVSGSRREMGLGGRWHDARATRGRIVPCSSRA